MIPYRTCLFVYTHHNSQPLFFSPLFPFFFFRFPFPTSRFNLFCKYSSSHLLALVIPSFPLSLVTTPRYRFWKRGGRPLPVDSSGVWNQGGLKYLQRMAPGGYALSSWPFRHHAVNLPGVVGPAGNSYRKYAQKTGEGRIEERGGWMGSRLGGTV